MGKQEKALLGLEREVKHRVSSRSNTKMADEPATNKISLEEVKKHNAAGSSWLIIHNQVFDVTKFLDEVCEHVLQG